METTEDKKAKQAELKAKREAEWTAKERAKREAKEAKERTKLEAKEAKERVKRETAEAKQAQLTEAEVVEREIEKEVEPDAKEAVSAEFYEGFVELAIASPVDFGQLRELEECLGQIQDLRLELVGGSVNGGTEIVVWAGKPIPLVDILHEIAPVEQATKKGKKIQLTLKM